MATGIGPCRSALADQSHQSPDELGEDDLNVVLEALHPVAAKYLFLGVAMKVKMNEIKKIQKRCSDPDECLLEVLLLRLKQIPSLTWRDIDTALRSGPVGEVRLANRIREQYGHLYPSSQASLDHKQGRNISEIAKNATMEEKKEMKYVQKQDIDEEVSEMERHKKPSEKLEMDSDSITNEAVVKETEPMAKEFPYTKRHSEPDEDYEREMQPEGKTKKATHDREKSESSTDTDNSSPEIDMLKNITEAESKGLRKVFKHFFGRLCFTIKAPVELATRLQMKGLLTYSVMNELLTSPESEQAKSITLVRALQKQVKSRPDKMFNIIDVFLHDKVMQQTGREIWTETGKNSVLIYSGVEQILQNSTSMQEKFVLKDLPSCLAVNYLQEMKVIHNLLLSMGI